MHQPTHDLRTEVIALVIQFMCTKNDKIDDTDHFRIVSDSCHLLLREWMR